MRAYIGDSAPPKLITIYHKNNLKKLIATFFPLNIDSSMARPIIDLTKQKRD